MNLAEHLPLPNPNDAEQRLTLARVVEAALEANLRTVDRDVEITVRDVLILGNRTHETHHSVRLSRPL